MGTDVSLIEECRNSKTRNQAFYRLHITKEGKKTTVSFDTFSYELLCIRLEAVPHTKEARKKVVEWLDALINNSATYDKDAPYAFSQWLKKQVTLAICDKNLSEKRERAFFDEDLPLDNYDLFS